MRGLLLPMFRHATAILTITALVVNGIAAVAHMQSEAIAGPGSQIPAYVDPNTGKSAWQTQFMAQCDLMSYCNNVSQTGCYCSSWTCPGGECGSGSCAGQFYKGICQYGNCAGAQGSTSDCTYCPQGDELICAYGTATQNCTIINNVASCSGAGCDWYVYYTNGYCSN